MIRNPYNSNISETRVERKASVDRWLRKGERELAVLGLWLQHGVLDSMQMILEDTLNFDEVSTFFENSDIYFKNSLIVEHPSVFGLTL